MKHIFLFLEYFLKQTASRVEKLKIRLTRKKGRIIIDLEISTALLFFLYFLVIWYGANNLNIDPVGIFVTMVPPLLE